MCITSFRCCGTLLYGVCDENDALHCRSSVFKPTVILYIFPYGDTDYMYVHLIYCNNTDHHHHETSHVRTIAIVTSIIVGTSGMIHCFSTVTITIVIKHE